MGNGEEESLEQAEVNSKGAKQREREPVGLLSDTQKLHQLWAFG